jgi:hypothetical protein
MAMPNLDLFSPPDEMLEDRNRVIAALDRLNRRYGVLASLQRRMLSSVEVLVSSARRRRHTDLLEVFSETSASLFALLPEGVSDASPYS